MKVIPAIDLRAGRCVRLYQGDYGRETRYDTDPVALAQSYAAAGASCVHVVDLDGARSGIFSNLSVIQRMAGAIDIPVQCGGGIRLKQDMLRLFEAGVYRAVIGSLAVREPETVASWVDSVGADRICLALDVRENARGHYVPAVTGWTEATNTTIEQVVDAYRECSLNHVLCTDIGRDGTLQGPNVALYRQLTAAYPQLAMQASGGVSDENSLKALHGLGLAGVIVGRALLDGRLDIGTALTSGTDE